MPSPSVTPLPFGGADAPVLRWPFAQVYLPEATEPTLCLITGVYEHAVQPPALRDAKGREHRRPADGWPLAPDGTPLPGYRYVDALAFPRGKPPRPVAFVYEEHQPRAAGEPRAGEQPRAGGA